MRTSLIMLGAAAMLAESMENSMERERSRSHDYVKSPKSAKVKSRLKANKAASKSKRRNR